MARPGDPRGSRAWRRLRAHLIATTPRPVVCWRCEQVIDDPNTAQLGHLVDLATAPPGTPLQVALEHPRCNMAAGGRLGNELSRHPPRAPYLTTRPDAM